MMAILIVPKESCILEPQSLPSFFEIVVRNQEVHLTNYLVCFLKWLNIGFSMFQGLFGMTHQIWDILTNLEVATVAENCVLHLDDYATSMFI